MNKCLLLLLFALSLIGCRPSSLRPNIILIVVDDMGWSDLGCYGNDFFETPHIDRMAENGVRFTNAYASCPVCSPSRASILTGKYPVKVDVTDWIPGRQFRIGLEKDKKLKVPEFSHQLDTSVVTLAEKLKEGGYRTAHIGKWHLGGEGYLPEDQGFDLNIAGDHQGSPASYFYPYESGSRQVPHLRKEGEMGEYLTDRLVSEAIKFISETKEGPFFLYLPFYTVHIPLQGKQEKISKYEEKKTVSDSRWNNPHYAAMVESLDENVGRLIGKLEELRIHNNTFLMLTSDNGGLSVEEGKFTPATTNYPLRAGKGYLYEGGIREPLIISYSPLVEAGRISDAVVSSIDIFPTIMDLAGISFENVDGISMLPILKGDAPGDERTLFWHYPHYSNQGGNPGGAVRLGRYKLIEFFDDGHLELYDLLKDTGENEDISRQNPGTVMKLHGLLKNWRRETNANMPEPNPEYECESE